MQFLRNLLANLVALFIFGIIGVVILVSIGLSDSDVPEQKDQTVLHLKLKGLIPDRAFSSEFQLAHESECKNGLVPLVKAIETATVDTTVKAILIEVGEVEGGIANLTSLRRSLNKFQASGRKVFVYSDGMSQLGYYLASAADSIFVHPISHVEWKGLGAQLMYFKSMLDKIGIEAEPIRVGKFKSAVEPYMLDSISPANEKQVRELLFDLWGTLCEDVARDRGMTVKKLNELSDEFGLFLPKEALENNIIDGILYEDEIWKFLEEEVKGYSLMSPFDYNEVHTEIDFAKDKIVVVHAEGAIVDGKAETDISSDQYSKILDDVLKDNKVKALVVRINSPGGSAKASEKLWRRLSLINEKMPVIVSMGNVAASGGYYIAAAADTILAEKGTVTGSIGVFGLMFNVEELTNKIGVNIEKVKTNELSDFPSFDRNLTEKERSRIQKAIDEIYKGFLEHVSKGRGLTTKDVEGLAQGRVWSGEQALKLGLVDSIGDLSDAIAIAAESAKLEKYKLVELPKELSVMEKIINTLDGGNVSLPAPFTQYNYMIQNPDFFTDFQEPQARLPYVISIQ